MPDIPYGFIDPERSEFTLGQLVECTCDHPADAHEFAEGCCYFDVDGVQCGCMWWDE